MDNELKFKVRVYRDKRQRKYDNDVYDYVLQANVNYSMIPHC